jgi:hypothetical protein
MREPPRMFPAVTGMRLQMKLLQCQVRKIRRRPVYRFPERVRRTGLDEQPHRNLTHVEALGFGRKLRPHDTCHEVDTQDRADNAERVGDGITDRGFLVLDDIERCLER